MNKDSNQQAHQDISNLSHQTADVSNVLKTPGQLLREQRLKLAMDERQAADHLKITCTKLKAIEADNYDLFSSSVYVRGHLRNYARLVNISDNEIMDCYYAHIDSLPQSPVEALGNADQNLTTAPRPRSMPWRWPYFLAAGVIVLWIVAYPFIGQDSQQQMELEQSAVFNDPAVEAVLGNVADDSMDGAVDGDGLSATNDADTNVSILSEIDDDPSTEQPVLTTDTISKPSPSDTSVFATGSEAIGPQLTAGPTSYAAADEVNRDKAAQDEVDQLVLSFTDDCWLEVTDADDNILAAKLHRAGDRLILRGNAPFNIMLGNVKAAEVSLNGKTVAVTPIGSRRTLRFMVDNS